MDIRFPINLRGETLNQYAELLADLLNEQKPKRNESLEAQRSQGEREGYVRSTEDDKAIEELISALMKPSSF